MNVRIGSLRRRAFTLLELIVVITIIGLLGSMVVLKVTGLIGRSQKVKIQSDLKRICEAAEMYYSLTGSYPTSLEEMKNGRDDKGNPIDFSIESTKDPWGNEYIFEQGTDGKPHARCLGKDGVEGGTAENQDYEYPESGTQ